MQYGYFDDANKEYVITRPDTPKSWSNYLGSVEYGAIITNNAGGYSFYKSAGQGRFLRMRFNSIPMDQPGRYIYIRDKEDKDYWSNAWQPVAKPLNQYRSECRHGGAYSVILSEYHNIITETSYFVPLGQSFEIWLLKVTNNDKQKRQLNLFTFVEYSSNWNALDDLLNIQYTQYTVKMDFVNGMIDHGTNVNIPSMPGNFGEKDQGRHTFLAFLGGKVTGFETDLARFIGPYRTYSNPLTVEQGSCSGFLASGDNACGCLQIDADFKPGEQKIFMVILGIGDAASEGERIVHEFGSPERAELELNKIKEYWHDKLNGISAKTPDEEFNSMLNMWSPYNCLITYAWSRAASLVYTASERDGLGYRDSVQDLLGVLPNIPEEAGNRLELMITGQVSTGGAMPVINRILHKPGHEMTPGEENYRSDDCMWLFNVIPAWVKETGSIGFYDKVLPYADHGEATVLGHLRQAIEFSLERSGAHGLPCGLSADWNDCLRFGQKGESVFVAMQLRFALKTYIEIADFLNRTGEKSWAIPILRKLDENIQKHAWDGEWFLRGFRYDGFKFGSHESEEGQIYLSPQSWAILSGATTPVQADMIMKKVQERLATEYGLMICDPPYTRTDYNIVRAALMNPGMKENGGIFSHIQGWAVMAEAILGHGDQAYRYFRAFMPSAQNTKAEVRQIEPYVYCQSTHSRYSPRFGNSRISWLSGSAAWAFYAATQYILGIQPEYNGLRIDPCIPSSWKEFSVERMFRKKKFMIRVKNEKGVQKGVKLITMNGQRIHDNLIPVNDALPENTILVEMG